MYPSIGIVIPTFQASKHLPRCLPPLLNSPLKPKILIIDSSSTDDTVSIARSMGALVQVIPQSEFNHGTTRERGRQYLRTSIIVMMTQDAYATSPDMLTALVSPLIQGEASISYARQIPYPKASLCSAFAREFNYPVGKSHTRSLKEIDTHGVYTFFCSNSCAAYLNAALDEVGGFPYVLFGEDTLVVAQLLHQKHRIAYVAEAEVLHSHDYSLKQEFQRHFDMGFARHSYQKWLKAGGKDSQRGKTYVLQLLKHLQKKAPWSIPYALLQSFVKFCGYQLGQRSLYLPLQVKKICSNQKAFWRT